MLSKNVLGHLENLDCSGPKTQWEVIYTEDITEGVSVIQRRFILEKDHLNKSTRDKTNI